MGAKQFDNNIKTVGAACGGGRAARALDCDQAPEGVQKCVGWTKIDAPKAPRNRRRRCGVARGVRLPTGDGVWVGSCSLPVKFFSAFFI